MMLNNYELQQYFLDMIKEFLVSNPDKNLDYNFIYSQLMCFNIRNSQGPYQNIEPYFQEWANHFENNSNIKVFQVPDRKCFLWFSNGKMKGNEVKLYIPLDKDHIKQGGKQLFDYISSTNIEHQSKIANKIRNDNIVVRVNNMEDAKKVIDYVSQNSYLMEGMTRINPFLPSCNGIGITMDNSYSYNSTLCKIISNFLNQLKQYNRLDMFTVAELNKYIKANISNIEDPDLRDIYSLISKTTDRSFQLQDFLEHANNKLIDKYTADRERITSPKFYFEQAIKVTDIVHPQNTKEAILQYLKGYPNYFTNQEKAREGLLKYVQPGDVIGLMRLKLSENNIPIPHSDNELVDEYLKILLTKELNNENDKFFEILKNAYINTLNVYNEEQARVALQNLLLSGQTNYFTNRFGDRTRIKQQMGKVDIRKTILSNINLENLDINDISEIVNRFEQSVNGLEKSSQNTY